MDDQVLLAWERENREWDMRIWKKKNKGIRKRKRDQKAKEIFSIGQYRLVNILTIRENLNHKIHIMNIDYNGQEDIYRSIYLTIYTIYLT